MATDSYYFIPGVSDADSKIAVATSLAARTGQTPDEAMIALFGYPSDYWLEAQRLFDAGQAPSVSSMTVFDGVVTAAEEVQIRGYMKILKIKHGLLINFQQPKKEGKTKLEIKEVTA